MISLALLAGACVATGSEPVTIAPEFRPTPVFRCAYPASELRARLGALLAAPAVALEARWQERLLGLPILAVQFDDPRGTSYAAKLRGPDWELNVAYDETFWPRKGRPQFTPGPYPRRLHPLRRGDATITWTASQTLGAGRCIDPAAFAASGDWQEVATVPAADSFVTAPTYARGRLRLTLNPLAHMATYCAWSFDLVRDAG